MGAVWKVTNSEQSVSSLKLLPPGVWLALSVLELLFTLGPILPAFTMLPGMLAAIAAACIAAEMLLFCGLHLYSRDPNRGPMIYWLVVAALCGFIV